MMASTAANVIGSTISLTAPSAMTTMTAADHEPDEAPRPDAELGNSGPDAPRRSSSAVSPSDRALASADRRRRARLARSLVLVMGHRPPVRCRVARIGSVDGVTSSSVLWNASRRLSSRAGGGSGGRAPAVSVPDSPPRMSVPSRPGSSARTDSGARTDQDADRGAGEPGHQGEGDTEDAELGFVARHHLGHPDRRRCREHGRRDAGDHAGRHEHPRPHVAEQQEPRDEPPQRRRRRQRHDDEEADTEPTVEGAAQTAEERHASQHEQQADQPAPVDGRLRAWCGRRQARRYTRCNAVVNELAKKIVSTRPSRPVACRTSSDDAKASLSERERVAPDAEPGRDGG